MKQEKTSHPLFKRKTQDKIWFVVFLLPALVPFVLMVIVPFANGIYFSFTNWSGGLRETEWIGLENYGALLSNVDFIYSFYRTAIYAFLNVVFINTVAFGLALLVTQKLKLTNFYRAGFFLPNLIGGLIIGYLWNFVYTIVLGSKGLGLFAASPLNNENAMGALIAVVTWQYAGYIMMIYIAALQNVPEDLIEASKIDGANAFQRLKAVILPLIAQAFTVALFLTLVTAFKQFDTVFSLTKGGPSGQLPDFLKTLMGLEGTQFINTTRLVAYNIYNWGYSRGNYAEAQAQAVAFFILLSFVSLGQVYYNKKKEVEL